MARFEPGENPVVDYYYFDGLGSTVMMTEGLSTIADRYDYDAWGNEYPIMVSTLDNPYRYVGQLGYYTHWMDSSLTDLLHLGMRFYEPGVGRFSQVDPAREGVNWYGYVDGIPTTHVDPVGLFNWCFPLNSRICNRSKDQCVIAWSDRSGYILLTPGQCTSWFFDDGDFAYWNGHWFKCGGGRTCTIDDRPPDDYSRGRNYQSPVRPGDGRPSPPPKDMCKKYCECQRKSRHKRAFDDARDCVRKCLNGGL